MIGFIKEYVVGEKLRAYCTIWSWSYSESYEYIEMLVDRAMKDYPTLKKDNISVRLLKTGNFAIEFYIDNDPNDDYNKIPEPRQIR